MSTSTRRTERQSSASGATVQPSNRYKPYKTPKAAETSAIKKRRVKRSERQSEASIAGPPLPPPLSQSTTTLPEREQTMREACLDVVRKLYPVHAWLDQYLDNEAAQLGDCSKSEGRARTIDLVAKALDRPAQVTGTKPFANQRHIFKIPIPDTDYSIRLWPGVAAQYQFCLDFVHTDTGEAINSPLDYGLWTVPDPVAPWLFMGPTRISSLENNFGVKTRDIRPGEEKFPSNRYKPYKSPKAAQTSAIKKRRVNRSKGQPESSVAGPPPQPPFSHSTTTLPEKEQTMREACADVVRKLYPGIKPRHDFDLGFLSVGQYKGPLTNEAVYPWLDRRLDDEAKDYKGCSKAEGRARAIEYVTKAMDEPARVTGTKPLPNQRHIIKIPIPETDYSIRLWPGVAEQYQFCLDFVDTKRGEAINSPIDYELWTVPNPVTPWLFMGAMRVFSLENNFGLETQDIRPGEEKFVLSEGMTYMFTRPGKKGLRFTVPIWRRPPPSAAGAFDTVELPTMLD
ncbi:hypothetical protein FOMPIDRAFT_1051639 [Fomitopsis schrenkii]|uniref:Uncharacterized protein n=1 Tax=Fomitopsis schrenkii TaxID=2126942 RepID=S8FIN8_FOMSC|nr:hypothetical protein FOMPIDRAFT_1051639 [Fomitopsis schrenkii]